MYTGQNYKKQSDKERQISAKDSMNRKSNPGRKKQCILA